MSEHTTSINIKDSTKIRLINIRWDGESLDDTIQRMLNVLEIKKPKIKHISFVTKKKESI